MNGFYTQKKKTVIKLLYGRQTYFPGDDLKSKILFEHLWPEQSNDNRGYFYNTQLKEFKILVESHGWEIKICKMPANSWEEEEE